MLEKSVSRKQNTTSIAITLTKVNPPMGVDSEGAAVEMLYTNKD